MKSIKTIIANFASEVYCYQNFHNKLPAGLTEEVWDRVSRFHSFKYAMEFKDKSMVQFRGKPLAKEILKGIDESDHNSPRKKRIRLFSGHDGGINPYIIAFNLSDYDCELLKVQRRDEEVQRRCEQAPQFSANFLYELARKDSQFFVRVLYNGSPIIVCDANEAATTVSTQTLSRSSCST